MDTTTAAAATCHEVLERFLAGQWTPRTRDNERFILARWLDWCHEHRFDPVGGVDAAALEAFIAELKTAGYAPNTIVVGRASAVSAFYRWCVRERLADRFPVGLIVGNVEDLGNHSRHHTLKLTTTNGDRPTVVALAPPTMQAVALAIGGRDRGPLLATSLDGGN